MVGPLPAAPARALARRSLLDLRFAVDRLVPPTPRVEVLIKEIVPRIEVGIPLSVEGELERSELANDSSVCPGGSGLFGFRGGESIRDRF